jgi:hypothetical protein
MRDFLKVALFHRLFSDDAMYTLYLATIHGNFSNLHSISGLKRAEMETGEG